MQKTNSWQKSRPHPFPGVSKQALIGFTAFFLFMLALLPILAFSYVVWQRTHAAVSQPSLLPTHTTDSALPPLASAHFRNVSSLARNVDTFMQSALASQNFSGSLLVAVDHQIVLTKGYGFADLDNKVPITPNTRFFLGSVTKEFTATAILLLQQQNKLHLGDRLCSYIPDCPDPWRPITLREVLTHTSGIPVPADSAISMASPAAWIASFDNLPLEFTPGKQFDYCSICYQVLGYVVQHASGEPYGQYVQHAIFNRLNMLSTSFDSRSYYAQPDHATGYNSWDNPAMPLGWDIGSQWSFLDASGLLTSTVADLYRWDQALYTDAILPQTILHQAFTPAADAAELFPGSDYGYGWFLTSSPVPGHRLIWHDGAIDGFRNYIGRYVDDDVTIITLSNLASLDPVAFARSLQQVAFKSLS